VIGTSNNFGDEERGRGGRRDTHTDIQAAILLRLQRREGGREKGGTEEEDFGLFFALSLLLIHMCLLTIYTSNAVPYLAFEVLRRRL